MAKDELSVCENGIKLNGKVALITGATSGMGLEIAKNLAKRKAKLIIASRSAVNLENAKKTIIEASGNEDIVTRQMDFESLKSIRSFASETMRTEPRLDILINNVGAIGLEDRLTEDGLHTMMQVNYFGMFLLTYLLFPLLKASAPSRVVNVSSFALILGDPDVSHWNDVGRYSNFGFYSNSKLAAVLFTAEMERRIKGSGVSIYSMDPGVFKSEFFNRFENPYKTFWNGFLSLIGRFPNRTATVPVFLAADPRVQDKSGRHFRDCKEFYSSWYVNDTILTERLWRDSKRLVGITREEDWELTNLINS